MLKFIGRILPAIIKALSPQIKEETVEFVKVLDKKAQATPNPIDDVFVMILKLIINTED